MAETAAILNPSKILLIPEHKQNVQWPHAPKRTTQIQRRYPDAAVVLYVNTMAEAKAEADILCTSANAVKVVESLDEDQILFGPDMNLAWFVQEQTDKK